MTSDFTPKVAKYPRSRPKPHNSQNGGVCEPIPLLP